MVDYQFLPVDSVQFETKETERECTYKVKLSDHMRSVVMYELTLTESFRKGTAVFSDSIKGPLQAEDDMPQRLISLLQAAENAGHLIIEDRE